jgi:hypothetical protein
MALTGSKHKELRNALTKAFPSYDELELMLQDRFGDNLHMVAPPSRIDVVVHRLVMKAEAEGWTDRLVLGALASRPNNTDLLQFAHALGLTTQVSTPGSLEQLVDTSREKHRNIGTDSIFLSYRRADSQLWTDRIADALKVPFGLHAVFQDVESIPPGVDFRQYLHTQLARCQVFLAVIGQSWLNIKDNQGNRRLDLAEDMVRLEIEVALQRRIPIIPLLLDRATMPARHALPDPIGDLAFKNSLSIRPNPDFRSDMTRLIRTLEAHLR